jgi:hypothetical protein
MDPKHAVTNRQIRPSRQLKPGAFAIQSIRHNPSLQPSTKQQYIRTLENYLVTGGSLLDPMGLAEYAVTVSVSTPSFLDAAVTKRAEQFELLAKGNASPDNIDRIQAAIFRAQVLQSVTKTETKKVRMPTPG